MASANLHWFSPLTLPNQPNAIK
ncbi:uncharacterized protein G2W53_026128 [Senna tora]|uniref:Uncharacterized protein n=1 Tax=Senna tora TaxID=362788 RepID=A0A834TEN4_9FABA|nr:uncharacterized protein G2W53_026128 [Senna tora]